MASARPEFLNVDLEIESRRRLEPLIEALQRGAMVINERREGSCYIAVLELLAQPAGPNEAIRRFARLIERLPAPARRIWDASRRRDFDIGIELGAGRNASAIELSAQTVRLVASFGGRIVLTCYDTSLRTPADATHPDAGAPRPGPLDAEEAS